MVTLQERLRRDNLRIVLDLLRRRDGISQIELVRETGLRASTVSNLVRDLRGRRCVRTIGHGESGLSGGKPPVMIGLEPRRGVYLGLLWDAGTISAALVDFAGSVVGTTRSVSIAASRRHAADSGTIIDQLVDLAAACIGAVESVTAGPATPGPATPAFATPGSESGGRATTPPRLSGVGVAVGSVVDGEGTVHPSADFPWHVATVSAVLRRRLSLSEAIPVAVENDANCVALDVRRLLPEIPETILSLVVTDAPYSAGAGILVRDRLVRGRSGSTGELLVDGQSHSIDDLDTACGTAIRMIDPDYLALALPPTIPFESLVYTRAAIGDRSVKTLDQSRAALFGAAYLAHREHVERIVEGDV